MKTMKNILIAFAASALVMPLFNGCKKGENDPAISLKSRTSRVTGEWKVTKMTETTTSTPKCTGCYSGTTTTTLDGTTKTEVSTSTAPGSTPNTDFYTVPENSLVIEKDGTYKMTYTEVITTSGGVAVTGAVPSTYA